MLLEFELRSVSDVGVRQIGKREAHMDADSRTESSKKNVRFLRESWRVSSMYGLKSPLRAGSG